MPVPTMGKYQGVLYGEGKLIILNKKQIFLNVMLFRRKISWILQEYQEVS